MQTHTHAKQYVDYLIFSRVCVCVLDNHLRQEFVLYYTAAPADLEFTMYPRLALNPYLSLLSAEMVSVSHWTP